MFFGFWFGCFEEEEFLSFFAWSRASFFFLVDANKQKRKNLCSLSLWLNSVLIELT